MKPYLIDGHVVFSDQPLAAAALSLTEAFSGEGMLFRLFDAPLERTPALLPISHPALFERPQSGLWQLSTLELDKAYSGQLEQHYLAAIAKGRFLALNQRLPNWRKQLATPGLFLSQPARIQLLALGDVGATCLLALTLLGEGDIEEIGIYDLSPEMAARYEAELNQLAWPFCKRELPRVRRLSKEELFSNCDVFLFAASAGVAPPGQEIGDVRQVQYDKNSRIVSDYAQLAREKQFQGLFAVLSDPVERLSHVAFRAANKNAEGQFDGAGLRADQVTGFGLGVMHSRAIAAAPLIEGCAAYPLEGRAYGCHGEGLILATHPCHYQAEPSQALSEKVKQMNLEIRALGFKPYIAPAVASGAMSLLSYLRGQWCYFTVFLDGVYYGVPARYRDGKIEIESLAMDKELYHHLENGWQSLAQQIRLDEEKDSL